MVTYKMSDNSFIRINLTDAGNFVNPLFYSK